MKYILRYSLLFSVYGFIYFVIECIYKGKISDWRMFFLAGFIGVVIGLINNLFSYKLFRISKISKKIDFFKGAAELPSHKEPKIMEGEDEGIIT